jgi:hypothetical protein
VGGNPLSFADPFGLLQPGDEPGLENVCVECSLIPGSAVLGLLKRAYVACSADSDGTPASTPVGRRGSPMEVTPGSNAGKTIGGRDYSGHGLDRMQGRGVTPSVVEDTIANGTKISGNTSATSVYSSSTNGVTVVLPNRVKSSLS